MYLLDDLFKANQAISDREKAIASEAETLQSKILQIEKQIVAVER